jgi:hypothetical protein
MEHMILSGRLTPGDEVEVFRSAGGEVWPGVERHPFPAPLASGVVDEDGTLSFEVDPDQPLVDASGTTKVWIIGAETQAQDVILGIYAHPVPA